MIRIVEIALYPFAARARHAVPLQFNPCNAPVGSRRAVPSLVIICALALAAPASAEELGRLFFTPEQRTRMDAQHVRDAAPADNPSVLSVDGIVQRHGGERTVWINGVPQDAGRSDERAPESVPVAIPGQSQPARVKVGEKVIVNPASTQE